MTSEIMIQVLTALDRILEVENQVLLFLDKAPSHLEPSRETLKTSSLYFYPKIPLLNYSLVLLISSEILRLSMASSF